MKRTASGITQTRVFDAVDVDADALATMHPTVCQLVQYKKQANMPEQGTAAWLDLRKLKLTASDFPAVLGQNPYNSRAGVMRSKRGFGKGFSGNVYTEWGNKYESEALEAYCSEKDKQAILYGLYTHAQHEFLAGSPDAITLDGILVEIKCPLRRKITDVVPGHCKRSVHSCFVARDLGFVHSIHDVRSVQTQDKSKACWKYSAWRRAISSSTSRAIVCVRAV